MINYQHFLICSSLVTPPEIGRLYKRFMSLDKESTGFISSDELLSIPELTMNPLAPRILSLLDKDKRDQINFKQLLLILAAFSTKASTEDKMKSTNSLSGALTLLFLLTKGGWAHRHARSGIQVVRCGQRWVYLEWWSFAGAAANDWHIPFRGRTSSCCDRHHRASRCRCRRQTELPRIFQGTNHTHIHAHTMLQQKCTVLCWIHLKLNIMNSLFWKGIHTSIWAKH